MAKRHRTTPLLRLLGRLGWQRDPDLWTVHCRDGHGRRAHILVHLSAAGVCLTVPDHGPLQLSLLQAEDCTEIQGYLVSPPRPASEVWDLLNASNARAVSAA